MKSLALVVLDKKGLFLCFRYSLYKPMFCVTLVGGGGGGGGLGAFLGGATLGPMAII